MNSDRYIVDASTIETRLIPMPGGHELRVEVFLDGSNCGPEASSGQFTDGYVTNPHFHLGAQFQLLLDGAMEFPDFTLVGPAVHYTDHHVAYGPFTVRGKTHNMYVLHAKPAGIVRFEDDKTALKQIDKSGREITRSAHEVEWEPLPGHAGARRKVLIPAADGPSVQIIECPPGMELPSAVPRYGRFEVVYSGSVTVAGKALGRGGLRFVAADEQTPPLKVGAEGAVLIVLEFDENSTQSYGGNNLQAIELAAQEFAKKSQTTAS